jgi:hypothetical protein
MEDIHLGKPCCLLLLCQMSLKSVKLMERECRLMKEQRGVAKEGFMPVVISQILEGDSLRITPAQ